MSTESLRAMMENLSEPDYFIQWDELEQHIAAALKVIEAAKNFRTGSGSLVSVFEALDEFEELS